MKKTGHPKYRKVLFIDSATGSKFICGSSVQTKEEEVVDGVSYPVYRLSISAASHPLFTGSKQLVDAEGRVDKFKRRYAVRASAPVAGSLAHLAEEEPVRAPVVAAVAAPASGKSGKAKPAAKPAAKAPEQKPAAAKKK